jgi:hypothetical protein
MGNRSTHPVNNKSDEQEQKTSENYIAKYARKLENDITIHNYKCKEGLYKSKEEGNIIGEALKKRQNDLGKLRSIVNTDPSTTRSWKYCIDQENDYYNTMVREFNKDMAIHNYKNREGLYNNEEWNDASKLLVERSKDIDELKEFFTDKQNRDAKRVKRMIWLNAL